MVTTTSPVNVFLKNVLQAANVCRDTLNWYGRVRPSFNTWESFWRITSTKAPVVLIQLGILHIVLDSLKSICVHCQTTASHIQDISGILTFLAFHHTTRELTLTLVPLTKILYKKQSLKLISIQINILPVRRDLVFYEPLLRIVAT